MLIRTWTLLSKLFPGWSLEEIKNLSPRERVNYMNLSK